MEKAKMFSNTLVRNTALGILSLAFVVSGCNKSGLPGSTGSKKIKLHKIERPDSRLDPTEAKIFSTNFAEELTLQLTPKFHLLVDHLTGQSADVDRLFFPHFDYIGLQEFDFQSVVDGQVGKDGHFIYHQDWPLTPEESMAQATVNDLWAPLLGKLKFLDANFGVVHCQLDAHRDVFQMKVSFEGRINSTGGTSIGVKAEQDLEWEIGENGEWKIGSWKQNYFKLTCARSALFEDLTEKAVPDETTRAILRRSLHREKLLDQTENAIELTPADVTEPYFSDWESLFHYPSVSVVDIDRDNWDDLFILDRCDESVFLKNNGDGTFSDISESINLKLAPAKANCSLFFDVDNDGDADVLIGRTNQASLFFRNVDGKFIADEEINSELENTKYVSSISAADVNRDGLLDVYLSTYCSSGGDAKIWVPAAVSFADQIPLQLRIKRSHHFLERPGPPNILLLNQGGKLVSAKIDDTLRQWKNTFESVWIDVDDDGDSDLYVCSDFAPDVILRNDMARGSFEVKFSDITEEIIPGGNMCFGMGASTGDYNSDGQLDLYISNMYSKAGNRIMEQLGGQFDPRIAVSARGNFLYEKTGKVFKQVAGLEDEAQHVAKVGWSFGGQMADFDNDGKLDVYISSGFFTAPDRIAAEQDL